ncbi:MAG TPA: chorismate pyruvate-lyase family protein [Solirubrobacteraceae bacterium]|jgi:chorismate-pyruvate lyase|nr:chorismate pyruvate-lyase family protein [Solirubrobacteraceae bacterium]
MSTATSGGRVTTAQEPAVAGRLVDAHFVLQHAKSPYLADVDIVGLDPFLRGLLFTDGTVSRALEAHTLSRVTVAPVEQVTTRVRQPAAGYLAVGEGRRCLRRRVTMHIADRHLAVWAESYILPERLPSQFEATLGETPQGIGGSLQQLKLESSRELLCFGLAPPPAWAEPGASASTLARVYRIVTQAQPALLITEHFALQRRHGRYRLVGSPGAAGF